MIIDEPQIATAPQFIMAEDVRFLHRIISIRYLTHDTFIMRLEKKHLQFVAGQHIKLRIPGNKKSREYSVYNAENDNFIELLIKEVNEGYLTPLLKRRKEGEYLELRGPSGSFVLKSSDIKSKKFLFIASGTGISPFHSYVASNPELDYTILHGIRYSHEAYDKSFYDSSRYIACTTGDADSEYFGRVTKYLSENDLDNDMLVYLCGNYNMIVDSMEILKSKGFSRDQIFIESYF